MRVLALDTGGADATVALLEDLAVVREQTLAPRTAASHITIALREVLGSLRPHDVDALVAVRGPGSFTGLRIGLSAVKALAEATGKPLVAVSRLAVLRQVAQTPASALAAGRGYLYLRVADTEETLVTAEEARALLAGTAPGDVAICEPALEPLLPGARLVAQPTAADAARFGWARVLKNDQDDVAMLDAHYLWQAGQMLGGTKHESR